VATYDNVTQHMINVTSEVKEPRTSQMHSLLCCSTPSNDLYTVVQKTKPFIFYFSFANLDLTLTLNLTHNSIKMFFRIYKRNFWQRCVCWCSCSQLRKHQRQKVHYFKKRVSVGVPY